LSIRFLEGGDTPKFGHAFLNSTFVYCQPLYTKVTESDLREAT